MKMVHFPAKEDQTNY